MSSPKSPWSVREVLLRYEQVRHRCPQAIFPEASITADRLLDVAKNFRAVLLDAYGVLKIGNSAIEAGPETVQALAKRGVAIRVVTNGATLTRAALIDQYKSMGYEFTGRQFISSRELSKDALAQYGQSTVWGIAGPSRCELEELGVAYKQLGDERSNYDEVDAFLFLTTYDWTAERQALLRGSLEVNPRPIWAANPDLVAPSEDGFSIEPGAYVHDLIDELGLPFEFYGKPFANAFERALEDLREDLPDLKPEEVLMVGDSLHTDILGGAAAGTKTALIVSHGLFRHDAPGPYIEQFGIVPDFVVHAT